MSSGNIGSRLAIQARYIVRRLLRRGKYLVGSDPLLLPVLLRLTPLGISRQITSHTDLVVEGFPRSGNTFTVFALSNASNYELQIASHVHHPAQVKYAMAHAVPTLLVVREPVATLASYLIFGQHGRPGTVIREYISYHRELVPYVDRLLISDFSEVSTDLSAVISRINEKYALEIAPFDQSAENVDQVFTEISEQHKLIHRYRDPAEVAPRPSAGRHEASERIRQELLHPRYQGLMNQAVQIYEYFSRKASDQRTSFEKIRAERSTAMGNKRSHTLPTATKSGNPRRQAAMQAPDPSAVRP